MLTSPIPASGTLLSVLYAVGDIHGEREKLAELLVKLPLQPEDTLIFIGDYIDRGPDSKGVIDKMIELKNNRPKTVFLRGNHEQMMLNARDYFLPDRREISQDAGLLWFTNGGHTTLASYPEASKWYERIPVEHWDFVESTLMEYSTEHYHFVHAGIVPSKVKWEDDENDPRLWIREPFIVSSESFGKVVVFGHTPMKEVFVMGNKIGIDTAVAYGGPLSAIALDDAVPFSPKDLMVYAV